MVLKTQLEFLNRGIELELFANHELYMAFNYIRHVYQMLIYNRRNAIHGLNEDYAKMGIIDMQDLSASHEAFQKRRRESTPIQKLIYDEYELFKAMF